MTIEFEQELIDLGACSEATDWVDGRNAKVAWAECQRSDWMMWALREYRVLNRYEAVNLARLFAAEAMDVVDASNWADVLRSLPEVIDDDTMAEAEFFCCAAAAATYAAADTYADAAARAARAARAADAAARAADTYADAAADAAATYAAADAAARAARAADRAVAYAAAARAAAADAAADTAGQARAEMRQINADIIRSKIPWSRVEEALRRAA